MGTSGAGRFSDYSANAEINICDQIIENELLENYGDYDFSKKSLLIPVVDTPIHIEAKERIVVIETSTGNSIGALSTEYEKIRMCIAKGYIFKGKITSSDNTIPISIRATLIGTKKKK